MDPQPSDRGRGAPGASGASGALAGLEALGAPRPSRPAPIEQGALRAQAPEVAVPRHVRTGIRRKGPLVALVLPALLGLGALVVLRDSTTTTRGVGGFAMALLAAPLLPAFGAPLRTGSGALLGAAAASAALWFVLGAFAAARATRTASGGWGRFWSEYLWLSLCVWMGAVLAVVAANLVLGRVLL